MNKMNKKLMNKMNKKQCHNLVEFEHGQAGGGRGGGGDGRNDATCNHLALVAWRSTGPGKNMATGFIRNATHTYLELTGRNGCRNWKQGSRNGGERERERDNGTNVMW